ncbi:MAG: DUF1566 domain-containing protein [Oligoflexia bacterium]|nr:DUF1566 domain-containing protein [Oligoflexia bacterium]
MLQTQHNLCCDQKNPDDAVIKAGWKQVNGAYIDPETGLFWANEIESRIWSEAKAYCSSLEFAGHKDWRLPTVRELQNSVCKSSGYSTRTPCPNPRNHEKDLWVLIKNSGKNLTYWAGDLIPGDPYNTYYFIFDVEGQHIITSKNDKSKARCVRSENKPKARPVAAVKKAEQPKKAEVAGEPGKEGEKSGFTYYISALAGFGAYLSNEYALERYPYFSGDLRVGFNTNIKGDNQLYITFSGDIGVNLDGFTFPVTSTITVGPEYFIYEYLSCFASVGLGIISDELNIPIYNTGAVTNDTYAGLAWKTAVNLYLLRFGKNNRFAVPVSAGYSGIYTTSILSHIVSGYIGLAFFM